MHGVRVGLLATTGNLQETVFASSKHLWSQSCMTMMVQSELLVFSGLNLLTCCNEKVLTLYDRLQAGVPISLTGVQDSVCVYSHYCSWLNFFVGSYGSRGWQIIVEEIESMIPEIHNQSLYPDISPLTPREFLEIVLVMEVAARLVCQDRGLQGTRRMTEAAAILRESATYGVHAFPADDGDVDDAHFVDVRSQPSDSTAPKAAPHPRPILKKTPMPEPVAPGPTAFRWDSDEVHPSLPPRARGPPIIQVSGELPLPIDLPPAANLKDNKGKKGKGKEKDTGPNHLAAQGSSSTPAPVRVTRSAAKRL